MAKSDITQEQARATVDRISQELGLLVDETTGFVKVQGPTNKHRVYIQRARTLNRIDTTLPLQADDPAYKQLTAPNGSVSCHVIPDLVQLERVLRMLADATLDKQVPNKPRPFAATKAPPARRPKPVAPPMADEVIEPVPEGGSLRDRLAKIAEGVRKARIRRYMENDGLSEADAEDVVDGKVSLSSLTESVRNAINAEILDIMEESGIEVSN